MTHRAGPSHKPLLQGHNFLKLVIFVFISESNPWRSLQQLLKWSLHLSHLPLRDAMLKPPTHSQQQNSRDELR